MKHCYLFLVALLFVSTGYGQENILLEEVYAEIYL